FKLTRVGTDDHDGVCPAVIVVNPDHLEKSVMGGATLDSTPKSMGCDASSGKWVAKDEQNWGHAYERQNCSFEVAADHVLFSLLTQEVTAACCPNGQCPADIHSCTVIDRGESSIELSRVMDHYEITK